MEGDKIKYNTPVRSLLVIDDDESTQVLISEAMEGTGINVIKSLCGEEALTVLDKYTDEIFLVLLDIFLSDCDGWTLLKKIRNKNIKIPVIVISAVPHSLMYKESQNTDICDYITKPFDIDKLKKVILSYLEPPVDN